MLWFYFDRHIHIGQCAFKIFARFNRDIRAEYIGVYCPGINLKRFFNIILCPDCVFHLKTQSRTSRICVFEFGIFAYEKVERLCRADCIACVVERNRLVEKHSPAIGLHLKHFVIIFDCRFILPEALTGYSTHFISIHDKWIAFKS